MQGTEGAASACSASVALTAAGCGLGALGRTLDQDKGGGPRGTPTVDGDVLFALSEAGDLACLRLADGAVVWTRNILADFGGSNPNWLISESPLVDGANVIVTPGGRSAGVAALDKKTRQDRVDDQGSERPGRVLVSHRRRRAGCAHDHDADVPQAAVGVRATDGKLMWHYTKAANDTANVTTPVIFGNKVFVSSAYNTGGALLQLSAESGEVKAEEIYFTRDLMNHHGGVVFVDGYPLRLLERDPHLPRSRRRARCAGATGASARVRLTYADGASTCWARATPSAWSTSRPDRYVERGRFQIADQGWPSWAHPVVTGGRLYLRNQGVLASHDIAAK